MDSRIARETTLFEFAAVCLGGAAILAVIWIAVIERDAQAVTVLNTVVGAATGTFFITRQANQDKAGKESKIDSHPTSEIQEPTK